MTCETLFQLGVFTGLLARWPWFIAGMLTTMIGSWLIVGFYNFFVKD